VPDKELQQTRPAVTACKLGGTQPGACVLGTTQSPCRVPCLLLREAGLATEAPARRAEQRGLHMSGITADGPAKYLAKLEADAEAAIRELKSQLNVARTNEDKQALRARIQEMKDELARKKRAAGHSLF
jgi:hypothetical protein